MGAPAALLGDQITGACPIHQLIGPLGVPLPTPGLPFMAPLLMGCSTMTTINGKPIVLVGATGMNTPPHVGLFPADPFMVPTMQIGTIVTGSLTVLLGGQPAATGASTCTCCATPGTITPTVANVMIG